MAKKNYVVQSGWEELLKGYETQHMCDSRLKARLNGENKAKQLLEDKLGQFSEEDIRIGRHEDDKFLDALIAREEPVACTYKATLKYYLGGLSNFHGGYDNPYVRKKQHPQQ